jgi:hypothetical protein
LTITLQPAESRHRSTTDQSPPPGSSTGSVSGLPRAADAAATISVTGGADPACPLKAAELSDTNLTRFPGGRDEGRPRYP